MTRNMKRGFTLVEILIVVIILGILAAIVIPQFTNASQDARKSSLTSQLQTLRSQLELFKLQHRDTYPTADGLATGAWQWSLLTGKSNDDRTTTGTPKFGPYLQATPVNPINDASVGAAASTMLSVATDPAAGATVTGGPAGWVFSQATGKIFATTKLGGKIYDEGNPSAATNEQ
jgi:general secretion pathway protein G